MKLHLNLCSAVAVLGLALAGNAPAADVSYLFDSGAQGFANVNWSAGQLAIQQNVANGGWTMGGGGGPTVDFGGLGVGGDIETIAATGNGRVAFDIYVNGSSFNPGAGVWYSLNMAGNSGGPVNWTQIEKLSGDAWHNPDDATLFSTHVDKSFAEIGWAAGDGWFQLFWGSNSDGAQPVGFYLDNVTIYQVVPEPSTFALAGLGAVVLYLLRRRN